MTDSLKRGLPAALLKRIAASPEIDVRRFWNRGKISQEAPAAASENLAWPAQVRARHRGLERLVRKARAALALERLCRLFAPPLILCGLFVCVAFTGVWLQAPHVYRALGVFVFALALALSLAPARKFRFPTRKEALRRIDQISGAALRPAEALEDRLANAGDDLATRALWIAHLRRAEKKIRSLQAGPPSPRLMDLDRYALRATVLVGLIATGFVAGPERYARLSAAFDWRLPGLSGGSERIDAWIDPPAYTGRTPIVLNAQTPRKIEAPSGSIVVIHGSGGAASFITEGGLEPAKEPADAPSKIAARDGSETRLVLRTDARLTLSGLAGSSGVFDLIAIPDRPPSIELTEAPLRNARGTLTLKYKVADDYGVIAAEANFANPAIAPGRPAKRSLVDPPQAALALPPGAATGAAESTLDLSDHPWAGAHVEMSLVARDEGANEGRSAAVDVVLPQKPFVKPLARALVEQRRKLVLDPDDKARVKTALEALMIGPDAFGTSAGIYLGLRIAVLRLESAVNDGDLVAVADHLWAMALRIENGDLSEAERDLRAAEEELREALARNAPEEEIAKLSDNLRAAMDKFLNQLAEQQQDRMGQNDPLPTVRGGRSIKPKELRQMLERMREAASAGDTASAEKMLEHLKHILENLQIGRPRKADPRAQEMSKAIDELGRMSQEQQDLRDETYQSGESARRQQRRQNRQMRPPGRNPFSDPMDDEAEDAENDAESAPLGQRQADAGDLSKRQQALHNRLDQLRRRLNEAQAEDDSLDEAGEAMSEAQRALRQGQNGGDEAVEAQGRAVEALREGAQKLGEAMRRRGEGEGEGSGEAEGRDSEGGQEGDEQSGQNGGADPLGRLPGGDRAFNPNARYNPLGVPTAERARRVLDELRRRLSDPSRPKEEMDYLERLLQRF